MSIFGDYCKKVRQINSEKESISNFLYLDVASIDNKRDTVVSSKTISAGNAPSRARQETFQENIIYLAVRVHLMNLTLIPEVEGRNIISSTGFIVLRPNEELNNKFLFYYILSDGR